MRCIGHFDNNFKFILAQNMNNAMQPNANTMNPQLNATPTSLQQFNNPMQPPPIRMNNNMVTYIHDSNSTVNKSFNFNSTSNANCQFFPNIQSAAMNEAKARIQQRNQQVSET